MTGHFRTFLHDESGASIVLIALMLSVLIGGMSLAAEVSYWRLHHRAMQNAADAAAIAAATNGGSSFASEAKAVAARYAFQDGAGNVTVTATSSNTAPGCAANCYTIAIADEVPLFLSQVTGYMGTAAVNGQRATTITSTAVATIVDAYSYCILALASSGARGITSNGAPKADLNGCDVMSNTGARCVGSTLNATYGDAHGSDSGCGNAQNSGVPAASDAFAKLASQIPANSCGNSYPQEPTKPHDPPLPSSNQWVGTYSFTGNKVVCGDQQLTGNTTINNAVLVIENGVLDTNGFALSGSGLTVIFTGTNNPNYQHVPTGNGTLDIAAPTSGPWSGVAIYQDPALTMNMDIVAAGNSPTWNISGLVYLPHSAVTLSGAVNKSSQGASCFELVVDNVTINGTGSIFANDSQCSIAGLDQTRGGHRGMLVN